MKTQEFHNQIQKARDESALGLLNEQIQFVLEDPNAEDTAEILHSILEDIGELKAEGCEIPERVIAEAKSAYELAISHGLTFDDMLDEINIEDLEMDIGFVVDSISKIQTPPNFWESPEEEADWESRFGRVQEQAMDVITELLYLDFFESGMKRLKINEIVDFDNLYEQVLKNKSCFVPFTFAITKFMSRYEICNPLFKQFVSWILQSKSHVAKECFFRRWMSPDQVFEIVNNTSSCCDDELLLPAFINTSIAIRALTDFITLEYLAQSEKGLEVFRNIYQDDPLYMKIQDRYYSVHVYDQSKKSIDGYGLNTDVIDIPNYSGGVFSSMVRYPGGATLVRFDRVADREEMKQLIDKQTPLIADFIRIPFTDVFSISDRRDAFITETAKMIIRKSGDTFRPGYGQDPDADRIIADVYLRDIFARCQEETQCADDYLYSMTAGRETDDSDVFPVRAFPLKVSIPNKNDTWKLISTLEMITQRRRGKFCCFALGVKDNNSEILINGDQISNENSRDIIDFCTEKISQYHEIVIVVAKNNDQETLEKLMQGIQNKDKAEMEKTLSQLEKTLYWITITP